MGPVIVWGALCDGGWKETGASEAFSLDLAYGIGENAENDFELTLTDDIPLDGQTVVYVEGTPYGGVVDAVSFDTDARELAWSGRTWQGVLEHRVLRPPSGQNYLVASGTVAQAIALVIANSGDLNPTAMPIGVGDCPSASVYYQFARYCNAWEGLVAMLRGAGLRPTFRVSRSEGVSRLLVGATAIRTVGDEVDSDLVRFSGTRQFRTTEHLVCGGQGELAQRTIVDLYAHRTSSGWSVSESGTDAGHPLGEVSEFYDYSSAESRTDLVQYGTEHLLEYQTDGEFSVDLDPSAGVDVGDVVVATEARLGLSVRATVESAICKVGGGVMTVSYKTAMSGLSSGHVPTD